MTMAAEMLKATFEFVPRLMAGDGFMSPLSSLSEGQAERAVRCFLQRQQGPSRAMPAVG